MAYQWDNFRLSCLKMNARKSDFQDVLDPFSLPINCFVLDFPSLLIKANQDIPASLKEKVLATIKRLKLNEDDNCIKGRQDWLMPYCYGEYPFNYLKSKAPFIAHELERQGLIDKIAIIMGVQIASSRQIDDHQQLTTNN